MFPDVVNHSMPDIDGQMGKFMMDMPGLPSMGKRGEPTPSEMEAAADKVRYSKHVAVKSVNVRTFDLSVDEQARAYEELYCELYAKVSLKQVLITDRSKQFVSTAEGGRWLLHLEWLEYDLKVTDHMQRSPDNGRGPTTPVQYRPSDSR